MPKFITTLAVFIFTLSQSFSAPFKMEGKYSFSGKISSYLWVAKSSFQYEGDDFVLQEHESIPAYYIILDTEGLSKKAAEELSYMCGHTFHTLSHRFHSLKLKKNQVMVYVPAAKLKNIKRGLKVSVKDYTGWGDENMSRVVWKNLTIGKELVKSPIK